MNVRQDAEVTEEGRLRDLLFGDPHLFYEKDYLSHRAVRRGWYSADLAASFDEFDCTRELVVDRDRIRARHFLDQRCYVDFRLRLVDHLVSDHGDRMTMASSVEGRYPFLDRSVAELSTRMQPDLKLREYTEKYVLREVARRIGVPRAVADREKFHFVAPGSAALLQSGSELAEHTLAPSTIEEQGIFNPAAVRRWSSAAGIPGSSSTFRSRTTCSWW